jgi:peptide deformylase
MALRPIVLYPDPVLRQKAVPVENFDAELEQLVDDMIETMIAAPGVGLAAPQVGVSRRVAVVDLSAGKDPSQLHVLVNPRIEDQSGSAEDYEGCLSIPDFNEKVVRPDRCRVTALDRLGKPFTLDAEGYFARAVFHEIDHLDGVLFVDYLRGLRREKAKRFLRRLVRDQESGI